MGILQLLQAFIFFSKSISKFRPNEKSKAVKHRMNLKGNPSSEKPLKFTFCFMYLERRIDLRLNNS